MDALKVYTTGEAAKICGISQQSIIRHCDMEKLGHFLVPGSKFRRIPRAALVRFMASYGIPFDAIGELSASEREIVAEIRNSAGAALG